MLNCAILTLALSLFPLSQYVQTNPPAFAHSSLKGGTTLQPPAHYHILTIGCLQAKTLILRARTTKISI